MRRYLTAIACAIVGVGAGPGCDISFGLLHFDSPLDAASSVGCSAGIRAGFPEADYPSLAACAGSWGIAGLDKAKTQSAECMGGGSLCSAADLCADGWEVCQTAADVSRQLNGVGCDDPISGEGFYATNQPASGGSCATAGTDDLFGCGREGMPTTKCFALTKTSGDGCDALDGWLCPGTTQERTMATKVGNAGGVLCCKQSDR